jgi:hypothetical protein
MTEEKKEEPKFVKYDLVGTVVQKRLKDVLLQIARNIVRDLLQEKDLYWIEVNADTEKKDGIDFIDEKSLPGKFLRVCETVKERAKEHQCGDVIGVQCRLPGGITRFALCGCGDKKELVVIYPLDKHVQETRYTKVEMYCSDDMVFNAVCAGMSKKMSLEEVVMSVQNSASCNGIMGGEVRVHRRPQ